MVKEVVDEVSMANERNSFSLLANASVYLVIGSALSVKSSAVLSV